MRSRHELATQIRQLSSGLRIEGERNRRLESLCSVEVKQEEKLSAYTLLLSEHQTFKATSLYMPVLLSERSHEKDMLTYVFRIPSTEKQSEKPVKSNVGLSYSNRITKIKRKRKRSTTFSRIEELLSSGRNYLLMPDPSEESIIIESPGETQESPGRHITNLSEDILQKIFCYFSLRERCTILSTVCKTWYYILKNPIFWKYLSFTGDKVPTCTIIELVNGSPLLCSLKLTAVPEVSVILQEVFRDKAEMKELAVRHCALNRIDCVQMPLQIINSFPNLEVLDLEGTEFQSKGFFTELCLLKNLKSINLGANKLIHSRDLMTISINCRGLEILQMLDIPSGTNEKLNDENFSFIIKNLHKSLTHLKYDMQQLGNSAYLAILQCKKLNTLCLTNCLFLTGEMFRKFNQLEKLKKLTLTRAINLTSEDFESLFGSGELQSMEELNINGCWQIDESGLNAIVKGLPFLKMLSLEKCKLIKGQDIKHMSGCDNLSALNLAHSGVTANDLPCIAVGKRLRSLTIDRNMYESNLIKDLINISPGLKIEVHE